MWVWGDLWEKFYLLKFTPIGINSRNICYDFIDLWLWLFLTDFKKRGGVYVCHLRNVTRLCYFLD